MSFGLKDLFTGCNLLGGILAIHFCVARGDVRAASYCLLLACVADVLDGAVARATGRASRFGAQLDTIVDHVSQCVAPAVVVYCAWRPIAPAVAVALAFLVVAAGSIRHARAAATPPVASHWVGLPRTASMLVAIGYLNGKLGALAGLRLGALAIVALCALNVSSLRFLSHHGGLSRRARTLVAIAGATIGAAAVVPGAPWLVFDVVLVWALAYMAVSTAMRRIVVAIDGPAGAGKSTVTKQLARALGYSLLDTGATYRAVALAARTAGAAWDDEVALSQIAATLDIRFELDGELNRVFLAGEDVTRAIREPEISDGASRVSVLPGVRAALVVLQRRLAAAGGVVAEGRDIGTVVFPAAEAKFFLTASAAERARRRTEELRNAGKDVDFDETLREIEERDARDSTRSVAPLVPAQDAVMLDSSALTVDEVVAQMLDTVRSRERMGPG